VVGIFCVLVIAAVLVKTGDKSSRPEDDTSSPPINAAISAPAGCNSDWKLCSDNSDLVNHWSGWFRVQSECKSEAERRSKFGTPEWPWFAFGTFFQGKNYVTKGTAIAVEDGAKFSNGFGAMVKVKVTCTYDLNNNTVADIGIVEH
jgi:hypothetical protein